MKQRAKVLIEFTDEMNVEMLSEYLEDLGCRVERQAVLLPLKGFAIPEALLFKGEEQ